MYDDVVQCAQRRRERDTLRRHLASARAQFASHQAELTHWANELARCQTDVRRQRERSLLRLVNRFAKRTGGRLQRRRRQGIAARLRHDAQQQTIEALTTQVERLQVQLQRYEGIDEEYQRVFLDKATDLVARGGPTGARVADLSAELVEARGHARELDDAIAAGRATLRAVLNARRALVADDPLEDGRDRPVKHHLGAAQQSALRFARDLEALDAWDAGGEAMAAIAGLLLHYVDDLLRHAWREWSPSRTRAAMDGLQGYVEVQLRHLEITRATVVVTHDATEQRYIEVVALG